LSNQGFIVHFIISLRLDCLVVFLPVFIIYNVCYFEMMYDTLLWPTVVRLRSMSVVQCIRIYSHLICESAYYNKCNLTYIYLQQCQDHVYNACNNDDVSRNIVIWSTSRMTHWECNRISSCESDQ